MTVSYLQQRIENNEIAFMYDTIGSSGFGLLRTLPAVYYLGIETFTFPKSWRQLGSVQQHDYLSYDYLVLGQDELSGVDLCAITNQNFESHTEFTLRPVLSRYQQSDQMLFLIADRRKFDPQGGQRPLVQQPFVADLGQYRDVYDRFESRYEECGYDLPLTDTMNLFMQDNANIYNLVEGEQIERAETLFDVVMDAPYLPLYDAFVSMFSREDKPGSEPLDSHAEIEGLTKWLRRRIELENKTAQSVAKSLNRAVSENERVFDRAQKFRHPTTAEAKSIAATLDSEHNAIEARYKRWLSEVDP